MSWIGPRPEAEVLSIWYTSELPFYRYRHVVKPGISGWAQVNQGHVAEVDGGPLQAPLRLLLHQIFLALARPADPVPDGEDDAERVRGAVKEAGDRLGGEAFELLADFEPAGFGGFELLGGMQRGVG